MHLRHLQYKRKHSNKVPNALAANCFEEILVQLIQLLHNTTVWQQHQAFNVAASYWRRPAFPLLKPPRSTKWAQSDEIIWSQRTWVALTWTTLNGIVLIATVRQSMICRLNGSKSLQAS